jgi:hypothetical protein
MNDKIDMNYCVNLGILLIHLILVIRTIFLLPRLSLPPAWLPPRLLRQNRLLRLSATRWWPKPPPIWWRSRLWFG